MEDLGINRVKAEELVGKFISNPITKLHLRESEEIMKAVAKKLGEDEEGWGIIAYLHDIDWDLTKDDPKNHCLKCAEILKEAGGSNYLIETIQSHGWGENGVEAFRDKRRSEKVQYALAASETLTGLIIATALVMPDKKLSSVKLDSLVKKFKQKSFAAKVRREIILECEKIGIGLEEFLELGLKALQNISDEIGL